MELAVIQRIASELNEQLQGGFINKIHQPLPREIVLRVRPGGGGEKRLMMSADPRLGRIHLTSLRIPNPPRPLRFCAFLRAHLQGARILAVHAAEDDRVVHIEAARGLDTARKRMDLVLELLGRDSNILLVDMDTNRIMDCLHHLPEKETSTRTVLPGEDYRMPPGRPMRLAETDKPETADSMFPAIIVGESGKRRLSLVARSYAGTVFTSANEAAEAYFRPVLESALLEGLRREIAGPLRARLRSLERRLEKIVQDRDRLLAFDGLRHEGELLKGCLGTIKKGMAAVPVTDWSTGETRLISLDPSLDPVSNMNRMFRKASKGKRGLIRVEQRMEETLAEKRAIEDALYFVETASDIAELEDASGHVSLPQGSKPKEELRQEPKSAQAERFREFRTPAGNKVLVGKNAQGNDHMLRTRSAKEDWWLHVKDYPGSHVIVRCSGAGSVTSEELQYAAGLAVYFSKARAKGKVLVMLARVGDLERIKGGQPGQVKVTKFSTIAASAMEPFEK